MPAKLLRCISNLMSKGKDKSSAIAICVKSTGLKMEKEEIEKLLDNRKEGISDKPWSNVDKSSLPKSAFLIVGDPKKKSTWKLPYKDNAGNINLGALRAISAAIAGARTGKPMSISSDVRKKIDGLLKKYKIGKYTSDKKSEVIENDIIYYEKEITKINFLETIKEEDTIGFYEYRRGE